MEKWDVHTHTTLAPQTFDELGQFTKYADFVRIRQHESQPCSACMVNSQGEMLRQIKDNAYSGEARIRDCDAHGVDVQVLSPTPMMIPDFVDSADDAEKICRVLNDGNAAIAAQNPERFVAIGALPMNFPDRAIRELDRIRSEHGMRGVEINSNINGKDLDNPLFFPIFEGAEAMGMAIFVHPWGGFMTPSEPRLQARMHPTRNWRPWLVGMGMETALAFDAMRSGGVHERLPKLRVLYAHGGGTFVSLLGRLDHGAYARPDLFFGEAGLSPYEVVAQCGVYTDSLTHNPWALEMVINSLGCHRVAMGSDYPYPLGEMDPHGKRGLYPGYIIEHLPESSAQMDAAWEHFSWIPRRDGQGLPLLSTEEKQQLLAGSAKAWLSL